VVGHNDASFTPHQKKKWHVFLEQQTNPLSSGICQIPHSIFQMSFGSVR